MGPGGRFQGGPDGKGPPEGAPAPQRRQQRLRDPEAHAGPAPADVEQRIQELRENIAKLEKKLRALREMNEKR